MRPSPAEMPPNSAFFKASMSQSEFDLSCMGVTAEAERRRAGTGAREEVRFAGDSPLEEGGFELSVPPERKAFPRALDRFRASRVWRATSPICFAIERLIAHGDLVEIAGVHQWAYETPWR
jgi:hypothetical protein